MESWESKNVEKEEAEGEGCGDLGASYWQRSGDKDKFVVRIVHEEAVK